MIMGEAAIVGKMRFDLGLEQFGASDLSTPHSRLPVVEYSVSTGTGADQMDLLWHDQRTLAASASEELDLADGTLVDSFGVACQFAEVRMICIVASSDNDAANDIVVGGTVTHEWLGWLTAAGDKITLPTGAASINYSPSDGGWPVTSGSSDTLQIANSAGTNSVTYDIYIGGTSA
jgi:hypothetical protein